MSTRLLWHSSAVLLAACLTATSSALDFMDASDPVQSTGPVAPESETQDADEASGANGFEHLNSHVQWAPPSSNYGPPDPSNGNAGGWPPTTSMDTPSVHSADKGQSAGHEGQQQWPQHPPMWVQGSDDSNGQGWTQPSSHGGSQGWMPGGGYEHKGWMPPTGQGDGNGDQGWIQPTGSGASSTQPNTGTMTSGESSGREDGPPSTEDMDTTASLSDEMTVDNDVSLECSGSDEDVSQDSDLGLECSGSDEDVSQDSDLGLECSGADEDVSQDSDLGLECSGSDEKETTASTSAADLSDTTPTVSRDKDFPGWSRPPEEAASAPSLASSSHSDALTTATGTNGQSGSQTTSPDSSSDDEFSSDTTQPELPSESAPSTASSADTVPSVAPKDSEDPPTSTGKGEHATFGTVTSKPGECVIGDPKEYVTAKDVDWVFENRMGVNQTGNQNWIFDHVVKNKGSLNYCLRWDGTQKLSKTMALKFKPMLQRQYAAWNRWLIGYGCWPYDEIEINMVGFAVKDASLLDWTDDSLGKIYEGDLDAEGVAQCPHACYRFFDNAPKTWSDTSGCQGEPFDLSLWPKEGLEGGLGYDWGQEVNMDNMLQTIDDEELTIVSHEIGHGHGLPDFYEPSDQPNADWPKCIMMAGSSMTVTDGDGWMLRRAYESIRSRYDFK
ncbi:unnamed protein product [Hyaloperonospora brassicae]|uniref:Neutral zinc metallopeptidase n=1 Tax=Hyaloperonospora brassicae TaxID=162125 RepID=A0AAV0UPZ2_HYABA|nr:unnamed protein product [Hyaloperonospora brassicae]